MSISDKIDDIISYRDNIKDRLNSLIYNMDTSLTYENYYKHFQDLNNVTDNESDTIDQITALLETKQLSNCAPNGTQWELVDSAKGFRSLEYQKGIWVAGSAINDGLYYSTDNGKTWTQSNITTGCFNSICYGKGYFVTISSNKPYINNTETTSYAYYSTDGKTWTQSKTSFPYGGFKVAYANNFFVCGLNYADGGNNPFYYSTNHGTTWTNCSTTVSEYDKIKTTDILYADGVWYLCGCEYLYRSTDNCKTITAVLQHAISITYNYGFFIAGTQQYGIYYSEDGITWTQSNITNKMYYNTFTGKGIYLAISGNKNASIDSDAKEIYYSKDGKTWEPTNIFAGSLGTKNSIKLNYINYANGIFIAATNFYNNNYTSDTYSDFYNYCTLYSKDGKSWYIAPLPSETSNAYLLVLKYANGVWITSGVNHNNNKPSGVYISSGISS